MSKQIVTLGDKVPAFLARQDAAKLNQAAATGTGGPSVNKISIKGGKFRLIVGGEEVKVLEKNSITLALIRVNDGLHKAYYSKKWTPGSDDPPDCYSNDGIKPAEDSQKKQANACAGCKHNEWGSYVNPDTGSKGRACSDSKKLAVLPPNQLGNMDLPPYMLTVPAASMKSLGGMMTSLNNLSPPVPYNGVVVEVSFDTDASHPKLLFRPVDYLTEDQYAAAEERFDTAETKACVGQNLIPVKDVTNAKAAEEAAAEMEEEDEPEEEAKPAPKKKRAPAKKAKPEPEPEAEEEGDDLDDVFGGSAPKKAAPKEEDIDDAEFEEVPKAAAKKSSAPKATADMDDVFGDDWD